MLHFGIATNQVLEVEKSWVDTREMGEGPFFTTNGPFVIFGDSGSESFETIDRLIFFLYQRRIDREERVVTCWTFDIDNLARRIMCDAFGRPVNALTQGWKLHFSRTLARIERDGLGINFRSIASWTDATREAMVKCFGGEKWRSEDCARRCYEFAMAVDAECVKLGGKMGGTSSSTAMRIWSDKWTKRRPSVPLKNTEEMDWYRKAFRGGRIEALTEHDLTYCGESAPDIAFKIHRPLRLPEDWTIARIDCRMAYPHAMSGRLPVIGGTEGVHYEWGKPDLDMCGIAEASVIVNEGGPRVVGVRGARSGTGENCLGFPSGGEYRGVWTHSTLREMQKHGGIIKTIHRDITYRYDYRPLSRFCDAVFRQRRKLEPGPVHDAVGRMSTRLYGMMAMSRSKLVCESHGTMLAKYGAPKHKTMNWGSLGIARFEDLSYPFGANPVWAAEITARNHIHLGSKIYEIEQLGGIALHCHTDSITFAIQSDRLESLGLASSDSAEMGEWRIDWQGKYVGIFGPQFVIYDGGRYSVAGIPAHAMRDLVNKGRAEIEHRASIVEQARNPRRGRVTKTLRLSGADVIMSDKP